jgi:hypothetical protein
VRKIDKDDFITYFLDMGSMETYAMLNSLELPIYIVLHCRIHCLECMEFEMRNEDG